MERQPFGQLAERRLWRFPACGGDNPYDIRLVPEPPVGLEVLDRGQLTTRGADGPLEVGGLRIQDAVQFATQGPRHLASLDLEQRGPAADPPQERPDRLAALPRDDAAAATGAERGRQDRKSTRLNSSHQILS